jgi:HSP20 family protein
MLNRYEPWGAVRQLQNEMNRAFGQTLTEGEDGSNVVTSGWMPAVDIKEQDDRFEICADIPGVEPEDIEVTMENNVLTLKGERKLETRDGDDKGYRRVERVYGTFYRRFSLPDTADAEKISATGKNGVIEIMIPKKATVQPKRITVAT